MRNVRREMAMLAALAALVIAAAPTPSPKNALLTVSFSRTTRAATVRVAVVGATLAEPGTAIRPREGHAHLHYRLDQGSVLCTTATTMTFRELSGGMHTVTVSLAGDDHKELGPRQVIPINVADDIKDVHSTSPELGVLASIPYLQSVPSAGETGGIAVHKEGSASPGYNLYSSRDEGTVVLMDMRGRVLHRWSLPPGGEKGYWSWAHLLPNGDLIALLNERALVKVDKDSRVLWTYKGEVHHDVSVDQSGNIYTLTRAARIVPAIHPRIPTLADAITILSADGVTKGEISLIDALRETPYRFLLPSLGGLTLESSVSSLDVVHTNRVVAALRQGEPPRRNAEPQRGRHHRWQREESRVDLGSDQPRIPPQSHSARQR